jgi:hypothetical protein
MPVKNPAEYMRTRRAEAKTPQDPHDCPVCRKSFVPLRSDARFCSDACRAADRRGRHTVCEWQYNPGGWWESWSSSTELDGTQTVLSAHNECSPLPGDGQCLNPAVWARQYFNHHTPHLVTGQKYCDTHKPESETVRKVVEVRPDWLFPGMYYASDPR